MSSHTQTTGGVTYEYYTATDSTPTTKYQTGYEPYEVDVDGRTLRFNEHSLQRWDQRTPCWSMCPTVALAQSIPLEWIFMGAFRTESGEQPHMVYYVAEMHDETRVWYDALFLMVDGAIKTVYQPSFVTDDDKQPIHGYIGWLREEMLAVQSEQSMIDTAIDRIDTTWERDSM